MRAPPPVEFRSALDGAWRVALALLVGAAVAVPLAWGLPYLAAHGGSLAPNAGVEALGRPSVQGGLALLLAAVATAAFWLAGARAARSERTLRWDGEDWVLAGDAAGRTARRGDAALMLDLGDWMLVRFTTPRSGPFEGPDPSRGGEPGPGPAPGRPAAFSTWLPLSVAGDPARWAALRGALWNWRDGRGEARP